MPKLRKSDSPVGDTIVLLENGGFLNGVNKLIEYRSIYSRYSEAPKLSWPEEFEVIHCLSLPEGLLKPGPSLRLSAARALSG